MTSDAGGDQVQCCIAGGGPAGIVLGYLLARAGIDVVVLEKHGDFLRDFRGDTIHPSTTQLMHELGILDSFLEIPHSRVEQIKVHFGDKIYTVADFTSLSVPCPYVAFMPQWDFLDYFAVAGSRYPNFKLRMNTEATGLIEEDGEVVGVRASSSEGDEDIYTQLVVGADGRQSTLRDASKLPVQNLGAAIDALWMRVEKGTSESESTFARMLPGRVLVTIDRGDYWQCANVLPKGHFDELRKAGIDSFRQGLAEATPQLERAVDSIRDWDDVNLLSVQVNRLDHWWRKGLLFIGDAAHAMSPVGGIGINLAIQDAVAAANALVPSFLQDGAPGEEVLRSVQKRRERATRRTQAMQVTVQNQLLVKVIGGKKSPPIAMRLLNAIPFLRRFPARAMGLGLQPEHIEIDRYFVDRTA